MIDILILGYSDLVQRRIIPSLESIGRCQSIEIASNSKIPDKSGKISKLYSNYIEALESFNGDVVYISLHNSIHDFYIIETIKRGLNCIVDKPAILNPKSIDIINDLINENNCILAESVVYNYHIAWNSLIQDLGGSEKIFHIDSNFRVPELDNDNFRMNPKLGGGADNDMSSYSISLGRHLWKRKPENITISNLNFYKKLVKGFNISVDYGDNKSLNGSYGFGYNYENKILMHSEIGRCGYERVFSPPPDFEVKIKGIINNESYEKKGFKDDTFKNFFQNFFDSLEKDSSMIWLEDIIDSFNDLQMLKEAIDDERRSK